MVAAWLSVDKSTVLTVYSPYRRNARQTGMLFEVLSLLRGIGNFNDSILGGLFSEHGSGGGAMRPNWVS